MEKILAGLRKFQDEIFPQQRELFRRLSHEQRPRALFICCSDSRVHPNLITQTEAGDLFILRNPGNIVPPYGPNPGSEAATIEFAMDILEVPHIIVCGHSDCGAMKALLHRGELQTLSAVNHWLHHCEATLRIVGAKKDLTADDLLSVTIEQNVLTQIHHLQTHPSVAARLSQGKVKLHAWDYDIGSGRVSIYDSVRHRFQPWPNGDGSTSMAFSAPAFDAVLAPL